MKLLSERVCGISAALSIYINEIVYGKKRLGHDITTLSLGEAFFDIPIFDFSTLDFVKGYHYSDSQGLPELRRKIVDFYRQQYQAPISDESRVLITAGSKIAIYLAILATVRRGEEVLIHEPAWLSYQEQVRLVDAKPRFIPFDTPLNDFGAWMNADTKMLVINNPNNPAGRIYTSDELQLLVRLCREKGVWLLVDEAYSDFLRPGEFHSVINFDPDLTTTIVVNSLSKNMGMSGWRIGYLIANPTIVDAVRKLNQHLVTCAPTILQMYLATYFDDITKVTLPQARELIDKRERVAQRLGEKRISFLDGAATFYFFVGIGDFPGTSLDFALYLLLFHNISVVPGSAYGASTERFFRMSIGTESEERIDEALTVIERVLNTKKNVSDLTAQKLAELGIPPFDQAAEPA